MPFYRRALRTYIYWLAYLKHCSEWTYLIVIDSANWKCNRFWNARCISYGKCKRNKKMCNCKKIGITHWRTVCHLWGSSAESCSTIFCTISSLSNYFCKERFKYWKDNYTIHGWLSNSQFFWRSNASSCIKQKFYRIVK